MHWYLGHATVSQTLGQDKLPNSATLPGRLPAIASLSVPRNRQPLAVVGCLAAGLDQRRLVQQRLPNQPQRSNEGRCKKGGGGRIRSFLNSL